MSRHLPATRPASPRATIASPMSDLHLPSAALHPPAVRASARRYGCAAHRPVHQAVRGAHHLPRRADRRRRRQRRDGPAADAGVDGPRPRHLDLHQLARWLVHRADRDLRHDAVRPAATSRRSAWARPPRRRRSLLAAGTPGKRFALPHSRILIHQPSTEGGGQAHATSRSRPARSCACARRWRRCSPSTPSKHRRSRSRKDIERDKILTAEEAMEYGLIDQVHRPPARTAARGDAPIRADRARLDVTRTAGGPRRSTVVDSHHSDPVGPLGPRQRRGTTRGTHR